jgi:PAS domain S-box-containing protein
MSLMKMPLQMPELFSYAALLDKTQLWLSKGQQHADAVSPDVSSGLSDDDRFRSSVSSTISAAKLPVAAAWCLISATGRILHAHPNTSALLGVSAEDLLRHAFSHFIVSDDRAVFAQLHEHLITTQEPQACALRMRTAGGTPFWVNLAASAAQDAEGELKLSIILSTIDERRRAKEALEQHCDYLEKLVLSCSSQLAQSRDAAEAASHVFLSNVGHELRTPLVPIMGMTELALNRASDPVQIEQLTVIAQASRNLLDSINDILFLVSLQAGPLLLEEADFSLAQVLDDALRMQGDQAQAKDLRLSREIAPTLPELLCGDALRLKQIVLCFLSNAIKFSEHGEITVCVQILEKDRGRLFLCVEVSDHGPGLSPGQQTRMFDAFTQADVSTTRKNGGLGLGLTIAKALARLMGGEAGVISTEGVGSTFWATLWLKRAVAPDSTAGREWSDFPSKLSETFCLDGG